MNLPDSIRKSNGNSISYRYDAQGNKLSQRVWSGSTLQHTRHYLGNYFYENDTLQHIQFGDGRIVYNPAEYGYEYHYYHKDHLGNIRQVFRAESTTTYMATMEPENETQEMQQYFHNLSDSRSIDVRYNQTEGGRAVAYLDASRGRDYGPVWSKELSQGDSLHAAVLGMLYDPKEKPKLRDLLSGIGKQNSLLTSGELTSMTSTSSLGLQPLWLALQLARQLEKAPVPESYLGYILYDQDSIRYDSGRVEISRQAFTNPEELALDITATKGGFVEVYVYNGSASPVWYDQFSISSSQAVIIQENHYYPFGMQIAGLELDLDSRNRYKFNGNEEQDDFDLGLTDFNARFYDPSIGRFMGVDVLADHPNQITMSPYQFGWNNPILYNDPDGRCPNCITGLIGAGIGALVGGGIEVATQLYNSGSVTDWSAVGGSALQGGITGGAAGFTGGASLVVTAGVAGTANAVGGATNRAIQGQETTFGDVAFDATIGSALGAGGKVVGNAVSGAVDDLSNAAKGKLGEALTNVKYGAKGYVNGGKAVVETGNKTATGRVQVAKYDHAFTNPFTGKQLTVESKFNTSGLTGNQKAAAGNVTTPGGLIISNPTSQHVGQAAGAATSGAGAGVVIQKERDK